MNPAAIPMKWKITIPIIRRTFGFKLEYVQYCQYNRCYVHKLNDPQCRINQKSMEELKRWQAKAPMGIYGYEFDVFNTPMYLPFWNLIADAMKTYRDLKLVCIKTELGVGYPKNAKREELPQQNHRLSNYMYAQLMWNPDADIDTLLKDWCNTVYGAGGDAIFAYHQSMAKAWDHMKFHLGYFLNSPAGASKELLNRNLITFARKKFTEAENAVKRNPDSPQKKRALTEIALEKALFGRWENFYNIANDDAVTLCLPNLPADHDFSNLAKLPVSSKNGKHLPTDIRMFWSKDALHIQVVSKEPHMENLRKGKQGKDINFWESDNIEIFLDLNDGTPYRQFGVNAAGGTYDAMGDAPGWNPDWKAVMYMEKDQWIAEITIPFLSLGEKMPKGGDSWRITVIRNSKPEACGFPAPVYRDLNMAATVFFSEKASADSSLVWISCPHGKGRNFQNSKSELIKHGWQAKGFLGPEEAVNADISNAKLIFIETYQNKLPMDFYHKKLIPAVKNGAVAVFECYYWVDKLHEQFQDPSYRMKYKNDVGTLRRPSWFTDNSFSKIPNKLSSASWYTPAGVFTPADPEKWEVLAKQKTKSTNEEKPFILVRPLGKGMVVLTGDLFGNRGVFLENILEYNKIIKRENK